MGNAVIPVTCGLSSLNKESIIIISSKQQKIDCPQAAAGEQFFLAANKQLSLGASWLKK